MSARTAAGVASAVAVLVLLVVVITTVSGMLDGADDGDGEGTGATSTVPPASAPPPFCRVFGVFGDFDDWAEYSVAARLERGVDGFADEASQARLGVVAIAQTNDVDAGPAEPLAEWLAQAWWHHSGDGDHAPPLPPTDEVRRGARLVDRAIHGRRCIGWAELGG